MDATQVRNLTVSMVGDSMVASVDGNTVMTVASLSQSVAAMNAAKGLNYSAATGRDYGTRSWGSTNTASFENTTIR